MSPVILTASELTKIGLIQCLYKLAIDCKQNTETRNDVYRSLPVSNTIEVIRDNQVSEQHYGNPAQPTAEHSVSHWDRSCKAMRGGGGDPSRHLSSG